MKENKRLPVSGPLVLNMYWAVRMNRYMRLAGWIQSGVVGFDNNKGDKFWYRAIRALDRAWRANTKLSRLHEGELLKALPELLTDIR